MGSKCCRVALIPECLAWADHSNNVPTTWKRLLAGQTGLCGDLGEAYVQQWKPFGYSDDDEVQSQRCCIQIVSTAFLMRDGPVLQAIDSLNACKLFSIL